MTLRLPCVALAAACLLAPPARLSASEFVPVLYEVREGSYLLEDCLCDRPPVQWPIQGTMVLQRLPVRIKGELYAITLVDIATLPSPDADAPPITFQGSGSFHRDGELLEEVEGTLDGELSKVGRIHLESPLEASPLAWPELELTVSEEPQDGRLEFYRLHLVLGPRAGSEAVLYDLVEATIPGLEGSYFVEECLPCGRPTVPVPIHGTFFLLPLDPRSANPIASYALADFRASGPADGTPLQILGGGRYQQGGEVALLQSMDLTLDVNDDLGAILASGNVPFPEKVAFPDIDIFLEHSNPVSDTRVYSMRLVARPGKPVEVEVPFRRGDSNSDGNEDLSDAIFTLNWLFLGGPAPGCMEAADSNADGTVDLADAVRIILFLFQGGEPLPPPGSEDCGLPDAELLGCAAYPAC